MTQRRPEVGDGSSFSDRPPPGRRSPSAPTLPRVEGYDVIDVLGSGGMGIVFLARERDLDRRVALKMLAAHRTDDASSIEGFRREARALAQLEHPNIVPIHSFGTCDGRPYFTMAFVEGEPLSRSICGALAVDESRFGHYFGRFGGDPDRANLACTVVAEAIASALADVHQAGLVHRDVKPSNVIIDTRGRPVLVDFGIAGDSNAARRTPDILSPGTLRFMPPESLGSAGPGSLDPRVDLYAAGLTLFEMLTLRPAFPHEDIGELIDAIRVGERPRARAVEPSVPSALDRVVERAAHPDPDKRYARAGEMVRDLRAAARTLNTNESTSLALTPELIQSVRTAASWPFRTRSRSGMKTIAAAGAAGFLLAIVMAKPLPGLEGNDADHASKTPRRFGPAPRQGGSLPPRPEELRRPPAARLGPLPQPAEPWPTSSGPPGTAWTPPVTTAPTFEGRPVSGQIRSLADR